MKKVLVLLSITAFTFCIFQCKPDFNSKEFSVKENTVDLSKPKFPKEIEQWGNYFAVSLNKIAKSDFHDKTFRKYDSSSIGDMKFQKIQQFENSIDSFSDRQLEILNRISEAKSNSNSYTTFVNHLTEINNDIYATVPVDEQKDLL